MRLRDLLIPLMLISVVLTGIMPTTSAVTIDPGIIFSAFGGQRIYTVSHTMTFSSITIDAYWVTFNSTVIVPTATIYPIIIELDYIDNDPLTTVNGEKVIEFNYTSSSTDNVFDVFELKHSHQYRIMRNGVNWLFPTSFPTGLMDFNSNLNGVVNIQIYDFSDNSPVVFTNASTNVEETSATLNGWLSDDGNLSCYTYFQYGETTGYGTNTEMRGVQYDDFSVSTVYHSFLSYTRMSEKYTSFYGAPIYARFNLKKYGSPTGDVYCRIRYVSNDTIFDETSIDISTISTSLNWYTFWFNSTDLLNSDIYVSVEYTNGDASNYLMVRIGSSILRHTYRYISSWVSYPTYGININFSYYDNNYNDTLTENITGLSPGTLYHYRATATNSNGTGYGSDMTFLTKPLEPTGLTVGTIHNTSIALSWTKGTGANNTYIVRNASGYPHYPLSRTNGTNIYNGTGTSTTDTGLVPGLVYYYTAWSYSADGGLFQWSDTNDTISELTRPNPPEDTLITIITPTTATISWTKGQGANNTVVVYKATGMPSSVTDGTVTYNNTGTSYIQTITSGNVYYFKAWSYDTWGVFHHYSDYGTEFTNITGGGLMINCFDEEDGTNLTFNVTIVSYNGSGLTYVKAGATNTLIVNISLCPIGEGATILVESWNHAPRTKVVNIYDGMYALINFYLPYTSTPSVPHNVTYLYLLNVIDESSRAIPNTHVVIKGLINSTSYEVIYDVYTDGAGQYTFNLIPGKLYKVLCYKEGYDDEVADFIPTSVVFTFTVQMAAVSEVHPTYLWNNEISFTGELDNTTKLLYVNYTDDLNMTTGWQLYIYRIDASGILTLVASDSGTNSSFVFNALVNNTFDYKIVLYVNHSYFGYQIRELTVLGYHAGSIPVHHASAGIASAFSIVFGYNPFGWANTIGFIILLGCFFSFGRRETYMSVFLIGGLLLAFHVWLGMDTVWSGTLSLGQWGSIGMGIGFPVIILFIGILMLVRDRGMFGAS